MHPAVCGTSTYFLLWLVAAVVCVAAGTILAARAGFPAGRSAAVLVMVVGVILLGSKALYLAEASLFPADDYVPERYRGNLHGFRIPGGMLALAAALRAVCAALRLDWRRFGDRLIPLAALALVFIRLGCFMNGCCFGRVSTLPWAVSFPRGSWVFWYHATHRWIAGNALLSLPVHPLQLYFLAAALMTLTVLLSLRSRPLPAGRLQVVFYLLFFGTTAVLEPLRQNLLTLNNIVAPLATLVCSAMALGWLIRGPRQSPAGLIARST